MWDLISSLSMDAAMVWLVCAGVAIFSKGILPDRLFRVFARLHQELWLWGPLILVTFVHDAATEPGGFWIVLTTAVHLWCWWSLRDWPDENRWKRRGRRLKEKVAVRGGTLVVESATT